MSDMPERIYVDPHSPELDWCYAPLDEMFIEYIRAEKYAELEAQNKWISVDEQLPEEGQFCVFYYGIIDGEPEMDADFWEESSMTMGYSWQCNVTHWKPITPPEKADG